MEQLVSLLTDIDTLEPNKVLVVGDVMLDRYVHCDASHISPEAPVPVLFHRREDRMLGGAGNVARNVASLGQNVCLVTVVGEDEYATCISELVAETPRLEANMIHDPSRPTTQKCRFLADRQQVVRYDVETRSQLSSETRASLLDRLDRWVDWADVIIVSDYAKGVIDRQFMEDIIARAAKSETKIIVDPKSADPSLYHGATGLTPNLKELSQFAGHDLETDVDVENAARALCYQSGADFTVVTLGARGALIVTKDKAVELVTTRAREVYDVSGAGDSFISGLAVALARNESLDLAVELGNLLAGVAVGQIGTAAVTTKSAVEFLGKGNEGQILDRDACARKVEALQKAGRKVGFTNGCFDILHSGHVRLLNEARSQCDFLVVGLNSNASVRRLKGSERPIKNADERAYLLSQIVSVDAVTIFDEDDPGALIDHLLPQVLIKGADYEVADIIGAQTVIDNGGRVHRVQLAEGFSTTGTIEQIRKRDTGTRF